MPLWVEICREGWQNALKQVMSLVWVLLHRWQEVCTPTHGWKPPLVITERGKGKIKPFRCTSCMHCSLLFTETKEQQHNNLLFFTQLHLLLRFKKSSTDEFDTTEAVRKTSTHISCFLLVQFSQLSSRKHFLSPSVAHVQTTHVKTRPASGLI